MALSDKQREVLYFRALRDDRWLHPLDAEHLISLSGSMPELVDAALVSRAMRSRGDRSSPPVLVTQPQTGSAPDTANVPERAYKQTDRARARHRVMRKLRERRPPPAACPRCGRSGVLHLHHVGLTFSDLYDLGLVDDLSKHKVTYLCPPCHAKEHEGDLGKTIEAGARFLGHWPSDDGG